MCNQEDKQIRLYFSDRRRRKVSKSSLRNPEDSMAEMYFIQGGNFVVKSRYCQLCSKSSRYTCNRDFFGQVIMNFRLVRTHDFYVTLVCSSKKGLTKIQNYSIQLPSSNYLTSTNTFSQRFGVPTRYFLKRTTMYHTICRQH